MPPSACTVDSDELGRMGLDTIGRIYRKAESPETIIKLSVHCPVPLHRGLDTGGHTWGANATEVLGGLSVYVYDGNDGNGVHCPGGFACGTVDAQIIFHYYIYYSYTACAWVFTSGAGYGAWWELQPLPSGTDQLKGGPSERAMKRAIPSVLTLLGSAGVAYVVTRCMAPSSSAQPPRQSVTIFVPVPAPDIASGPIVSPPSSGPLETGEDTRRQQAAREESEFQESLEARFTIARRNGPSGARLEEDIRRELDPLPAELALASKAIPSCSVGICRIAVSHTDRRASMKFHHAVQGGELLNHPGLLNQDNGCNLHAFVGEGDAPDDVLFVECREGRQ